MTARFAAHRARLDRASGRLRDPRLAIASFQQTLDDRTSRLEEAWRRASEGMRAPWTQLDRRLGLLHPSLRIAREKAETTELSARLAVSLRRSMSRRDKGLESLTARLDAMSPLKVLARGYAIATRSDGRAVRDASDVSAGDPIRLRVRSARIDAQVTSVTAEKKEES
jgi:exodeoxyribonuclease VII large subunit